MTAMGVLDGYEGTSELDPFVLLDAAIERIGALDPAGSNDEALAIDVVRLRRRMDRLDATVADWTLAAHRRGVCSVDAHKSTTSWLGWKTGAPSGHRSSVAGGQDLDAGNGRNRFRTSSRPRREVAGRRT